MLRLVGTVHGEAQHEEQLRAVTSRRDSVDSFVRFAELKLVDIANGWRIAEPEQRERVQNLLFDCGLDYSPAARLESTLAAV